MDEAGQCNVATALIPIARASSLLLVGDPNQLKPVITLEDHTNRELMDKYNVPEKYNYKKHSILDVMLENDNISKYILLKYHYRCGKKIINFSNQRYYNNSLNLASVSGIGELELIDVKNKNVKQKNEAYEEASGIVDYIERNKLTDVFVITPFVNQKELITNLLKQKNINGVGCGTVHSAQGAEKGDSFGVHGHAQCVCVSGSAEIYESQPAALQRTAHGADRIHLYVHACACLSAYDKTACGSDFCHVMPADRCGFFGRKRI
jgi:superfamily I DNA and/or RNA helicase